LKKQGYVLKDVDKKDKYLRRPPPETNINIFSDVPVISEEQYNGLLKDSKTRKLNEVENACVKKYILLLYSNFPEGISKNIINIVWTEFLQKDYMLRTIKSLYYLVNREKAFFIENSGIDMVQEKGIVAKKDVFDKIYNWFVSQDEWICYGTEFSKDKLRELFILTDSMDFMDLNIKKFSEKTSDKHVVERLNSFFENTFGLKFRLGTLEQIKDHIHNGIRPRTQIRDNTNKLIDVTPYTLYTNGGIIYANIVKNTRENNIFRHKEMGKEKMWEELLHLENVV
jgi:hypothetical protein